MDSCNSVSHSKDTVMCPRTCSCCLPLLSQLTLLAPGSQRAQFCCWLWDWPAPSRQHSLLRENSRDLVITHRPGGSRKHHRSAPWSVWQSYEFYILGIEIKSCVGRIKSITHEQSGVSVIWVHILL